MALLTYLLVDAELSCFKQQFDQISVPMAGGKMKTRHTSSVLQECVTPKCMS